MEQKNKKIPQDMLQWMEKKTIQQYGKYYYNAGRACVAETFEELQQLFEKSKKLYMDERITHTVEEVAYQYSDKYVFEDNGHLFSNNNDEAANAVECSRKSFISGAEWQKEQILEESKDIINDKYPFVGNYQEDKIILKQQYAFSAGIRYQKEQLANETKGDLASRIFAAGFNAGLKEARINSMEQKIKDGVKMLKTKLKEIDEDLADTRYNDEAWYKQDVKFRDFIEDVLYKLEEPKSETPIPDTESLAEADWKEGNYSTIKYKGQDKARHHRIFRRGYNQCLQDRINIQWTDEDMYEAWKEGDRDYTNGYGLTYMEWIEQYKKNKK